jgi:hypothetical protein
MPPTIHWGDFDWTDAEKQVARDTIHKHVGNSTVVSDVYM